MASWHILEQRSFQAYTEEKPEIAIWALKNYADILLEDYKYAYDNSEFQKGMSFSLMQVHGRIALTYQKTYSIEELVSLIKRYDARH